MLKFCSFLNKTLTKSIHTLVSDTIFALSSGQGKCGVAVIRVSGANSATALKLVAGLETLPKPRMAVLKSIKNPFDNEVIDKGLILWFPGPRSFTGEDSFELQVHGGIAVINAVFKALKNMPQCRLAEPGEFTRRAFFNGKLDLTEVEGLADLLQAETEAQRKQAFLQTQGALSKLYNKWRSILLKNLAYLEAHIDFEETETLEIGIIELIRKDLGELASELELHLNDGRKGEILRSGVKTVILGEPNVGKSSLLNILCQRPAAIVTPIEGTTRDVLEVTLNINGYPLVLADTAGLRANTQDAIEKEGIIRALELYNKSDLIVLVFDLEKYSKWRAKYRSKSINNYIIEYVESLKLFNLIKVVNTEDKFNIVFNKPCILVFNKSDISNEIGVNVENCVSISCTTGNGISNLIEKISDQLKILCGDPSAEHPSMNQMRHRQHLRDCLKSLKMFLNQNENEDLVLVAENLRKSIKHLGKLVGSVTTEDILDVIFRDFCIGK